MWPCTKHGYAVQICRLYVADGRQRGGFSAKAYAYPLIHSLDEDTIT